jgi:hypothetical protein
MLPIGQPPHAGYSVSGRMVGVTDDGERMEVGPGDFMSAVPQHDAWIVEDEPCVVIDRQGSLITPCGSRPEGCPR